MDATLAFVSMPGGGEWLIIGMIGLLLFGKRLPEVGNSLGKMIVEFKKGLRGIEDDIERASRESASTPSQPTLSEPTHSEPEMTAEHQYCAAEEATHEATAHEIPATDSTTHEAKTHEKNS